MRPLVNHWHSNGIIIVVYLDDGFSAANSEDKCQIHSNRVRSDLCSAGFAARPDKCQWKPIQAMVWLGIHIDLLNFTVNIPNEKIEVCLSLIRRLLYERKYCCTARRLAKITGQIMSMKVAIGSAAQLMTRNLYRAICRRSGRDNFLKGL